MCRILAALGWLASVVAIFFLGSKAGRPSAPSPSAVSALIASAQGHLATVGIDYVRATAPLADLSPGQVSEALAEVERTIPERPERLRFDSVLLQRWAEFDGTAAVAYFDQKFGPASDEVPGSRQGILRTWAQVNPEAAWSWLQTELKSQPPDHQGLDSVAGVFSGLGAANIEAAFQHLTTLDDKHAGVALRFATFSAHDSASRARTLAAARSLPPTLRDRAQELAISGWLAQDSEAALQWLQSYDGENQKSLRRAAGQSLLPHEPARAAALLLATAADSEKPELYRTIVAGWLTRDPAAAEAWLQALPQTAELDSARAAFASLACEKEPARAMAVARAITVDSPRYLATGNVFRAWRKKDPAAAEAALNASGLPPEKIAELKSTPPPAKPGP